MRFLPHSLVATFVVMVLPSLMVTAIAPAAARSCASLGRSRNGQLGEPGGSGRGSLEATPGSQDMVFGDLMVWGWMRRVRAERRLAEAHALLGSEGLASAARMLSSERRCEMLQQLAADAGATPIRTATRGA